MSTAIVAKTKELEPLFPPPIVPNPAQKPFLESNAKFRAIIAGYGSGKTFAGAAESWRWLKEYPGMLLLVVAPTYPQLRDYTQRTFFERIGVNADNAGEHPLVQKWSKTDQQLILKNGSEVFFRSADKPASMIGSTVGGFWLDEPASCKAAIWNELLGRMRALVGPRQGIATGTPDGLGWVYDVFGDMDRDKERYAAFFGSTMDNSDNLPADFIESLLESYSGTFAQAKIYGQFVAYEGQVFSEFSRAKHMLGQDWTPDKTRPYDRVADFGTNHPTVWLWIQEDALGNVYIFDEYIVRRLPVTAIAPEVLKRWKGYKNAANFGDVAGSQHDSNLNSYITNYYKEGLKINTRAGGTIKSGVEVVKSYLLNAKGDVRLFVHPRCTETMRSLEAYHYPEDKDGRPIGDEPEKDGKNDHVCDTLRYWFRNRHPEAWRRRSTTGKASSGGKRITASDKEVSVKKRGNATVGSGSIKREKPWAQ